MAIIQQFTAFWQRQKTSQKITLISLVAAAAILIPVLISWATKTSYAVAFSGLSEADAGAIVEELTSQGISYKLEGSSTILVPTDQVYNVRISMASAGLPQTGSTVGYELFDQTSLGMTEFTQKVNYQRAVEGELERTIGSLSAVEGVSVHIVIPEETLLSSDQKEPTASIMIDTKSGSSLDNSQVRAITHLVASSIEGLKAENVVVVDTFGNMLAAGSSSEEGSASAVNDSRRAAEIAVAQQIENKAQMMLDSVLGPDKAIVQANVTLDWTQKEVTSNTFDPTPAAVRSEQTTSESYVTNGTTTSGIPGATSNLPTAVAASAGGAGTTSYQRTDSTKNYEVTSSQSFEVIAPGQIKQLSVSVLVDSITDQTQMNVLRNAVASAVGIDTARGDALTVESIVFDRTYYTTQAEDLEKATKTNNIIMYAKIGGAVLLVIVLLLYIQRLLKNLKLASNDAWVPVMRPVAEGALGAPVSTPMISTPDLSTLTQAPVQMPKIEVPQRQSISAEDEQMQKVLTKLSEDSPSSVAEIIQLWLAEDEK